MKGNNRPVLIWSMPLPDMNANNKKHQENMQELSLTKTGNGKYNRFNQ